MIEHAHMTYLAPLIGGFLIGGGSLLALAASGKIPGISGVVGKIVRPQRGDTAWRILFITSLIIGALAVFLIAPGYQSFQMPGGRGLLTVGIAGLLVGFGARLGGGCTSGHGICGIGAGAKDALIYTCIFMGTGAVTVFLWNLIKGGAA